MQIREDLDSCSYDPPFFSKFDGPLLSLFTPVTEELIGKLILHLLQKVTFLTPFLLLLQNSVCVI